MLVCSQPQDFSSLLGYNSDDTYRKKLSGPFLENRSRFWYSVTAATRPVIVVNCFVGSVYVISDNPFFQEN